MNGKNKIYTIEENSEKSSHIINKRLRPKQQPSKSKFAIEIDEESNHSEESSGEDIQKGSYEKSDDIIDNNLLMPPRSGKTNKFKFSNEEIYSSSKESK